MKKRFALLTMLLVMLCGTISASDYDFHVGGVYYRIIYVDGHPTTNLSVVEGDEKYSGDIVIPQSITVSNIDYPVTRIGHYAFAECPNLTSITFPSGINGKLTRIEPNAFQNCKGITSINIPNSVVLIDAYAFIGCSSLKSVTIGSGVKEIGNAAFNNCSSIERVDISDLLAWYDINFILYPGGYLGTSNPLYYAKHLYLNGNEVTELNIPDELTQIKPRAFINCEGLTSVKISNSASVTSIGESAFCGCRNIALVKLNNNLKEINRSAFYGCESIESLVIPDEVTLIADGAFQDCSKLKDLTLGKSVEIIGGSIMYGSAFGGTAITEITVPEKIQNLHGFWRSNVNTINIDKTALIDISSGNVDTHIPINRINITNLATFMGIKKQLAGYDLYLNGDLVEDISIPSSITNVGERGMQGCKSLKSITIPSHVETINDKAFDGCQSVEKVTFEGGSPKIGSGVFYSNGNVYFISKMQTPSEASSALIAGTYMKHILCVPAGCKEKYEAAEGWKEFRYIVEASGPEEAFMDRGNLYRIYGDEVTLVKGGSYAYWGYYLPETATYQDKSYPITVIGGEVHDGYSPDIVIFSGVKQIVEKAFANCTGVNTVTSYIKNPYPINSNVFSYETKQSVILKVPYGTKAKYQTTDGWKEFANIEEMDPEPSEPYVVYDDGTLTFYYDNQRSSRTGTTYGLNDVVGDNCPSWNVHYDTTTKVVFDASFSEARPKTTYRWFSNFWNITEIQGLEYLNTSEVTNMGHMFYYVCNLASLDVSGFDTGKVTDMINMFCNCSSLTKLDVSKFNTENVINMGGMFAGCKGINYLNVSNFDTRNVTLMSQMFFGCSSLTSLDVSKFNTSNVTGMSSMFKKCTELTNLIMGSQFTSDESTNMDALFANCSKLCKVTFIGDIPTSINSKFFNGVGTAVAPATLVVPEQYEANFQAKFDGNMFYGGYFTLAGVEFKKGDLNFDGEVSDDDLEEMVRLIILGMYEANADLNGDGVVNVADIVELVKIINSDNGTGSGYFWMGNYMPKSNTFPTINGKEVEGIVTTYTSLDDAMAKASRTYSAGEYAIVMYPSSWGVKDDLVFLDSANMKYYVAKQKDLSDFPDYLYYESTEKIGANTTITLSTESLAKAAGATLSSLLIK